MRVEVADHNTNWAQLFQDEAERLERIFGEEVVRIHHIGSTSVPGLRAKPILDMLPVVQDIQKVDLLNEQMQILGYEALGEFGTPGRRYFRKGGDARTHQVQVYQEDDRWNIDRHLAVRDFLRSHPSDAARYGDLKSRLAEKFQDDLASYVDGKSLFVKDLESRSLSWYEDAERFK
ncbi:GrpB family protein [Sporosarcina sp. A2]|uniref:GrpB family protein n=1 Tax=Sporosarcina sp. A2 TaxID=3393449 RepID=UPI003D7BF7AD